MGYGMIERLEQRILLSVSAGEGVEGLLSESATWFGGRYQQKTARQIADDWIDDAVSRVTYYFCGRTDGVVFWMASDASIADATNVQEAGIDEDDLVETDGRYIYWLANSTLYIVDTEAGESPVLVSSMPLGDDGLDRAVGMYLHDGRLTIIEDRAWRATQLSTFDVSDVSSPSLVSEAEFDGFANATRMVDGNVYLVLSSWQSAPYRNVVTQSVDGESGVAATSQWESDEDYRARLEALPLDELLPAYHVSFADGAQSEGLLFGAGVLAGSTSWRSGYTTVVSFDTASGSLSIAPTIEEYAGVTYMAQDAIFVTSTAGNGSVITKWALGEEGVSLVAQGSIDGYVSGQFAMDEKDGYLRVAAGNGQTNSFYVLQQNGDLLEVVGRADGIGIGERIQSVRIMDDVAYVVTFRTTDPLWVIDLSTPTSPAIVGELVIPGFSTYLHPIGQDRVVGFGWDTDETGRRTHLQMSLFDVSDPSSPVRLSAVDINSDLGFSEALSDHHAFGYFGDLMSVPVFTPDGDQTIFVRLVADELVVVASQAGMYMGSRSVQLGDVIYICTAAAIAGVSAQDPSVVVSRLELPGATTEPPVYRVVWPIFTITIIDVAVVPPTPIVPTTPSDEPSDPTGEEPGTVTVYVNPTPESEPTDVVAESELSEPMTWDEIQASELLGSGPEDTLLNAVAAGDAVFA